MEAWFRQLLLWFLAIAVLVHRVEGQGFISIDCGAPTNYTDNDLQIDYTTDDGFVDSGTNMQIPIDSFGNTDFQGRNLRMFPDGLRNCYTLRPDRGKNNTYLVRAWFYYGNYDNKNRIPAFDLHIGVNHWVTVNTDEYKYTEVIYVPPADDIQVCLINTGNGVPFISRLELRSLNNSIYQLSSGSLVSGLRYDIGGSDASVRYPNDMYDRIWSNRTFIWDTLSTTSLANLSYNNNEYKVPLKVLSTAGKAADVNSSLDLFTAASPGFQGSWCFYFHFAELEQLPINQQRELAIFINGIFKDKVTLQYLMPVTKSSTTTLVSGAKFNLSIIAAEGSMYPPILNAVEGYTVVEHPNNATNLDDVNAMNDIKKLYGLKRVSWQGDPCVPSKYIWDGLNCSYDNPPRIVSLDLSSSTLRGNIASSFSYLSALVSLNLSGNQLTGPVPEFLAELPNLRTLNLIGNNLTGSIPTSLQTKIDDGTLQLSVTDNPLLCLNSSCQPKTKAKSVVVPVVAAVVVGSLFIIIAIIWLIKRKTGHPKKPIEAQNRPFTYDEVVKNTDNFNTGHPKKPIKAKNRPFTYAEVVKITDNFNTIIGEGGFGKVYLGTLANETKVAVKMLSPTSKQGYKEFQAEAQLLMIVHHRNLVSLVGYCDDDKNKALIYEFMENGNLRQHLSDQSINPQGLTWTERLRVAIDAAQGLDYLHNGSKTPIIHRDLKTPNILLSKKMQAKIADFGLSRAFLSENDTHISTRPAGTPGYLDPEFNSSGNLNQKSDVYSFGVVLLELITGQPAVIIQGTKNINILQWVKPIIQRGDIQRVVDPRLHGRFNINSAWKFVETAMSCVPTMAIQRPDMSRVLAELKECWTIEMGSSKRRSNSESFEIAPVVLDNDLAPNAR